MILTFQTKFGMRVCQDILDDVFVEIYQNTFLRLFSAQTWKILKRFFFCKGRKFQRVILKNTCCMWYLHLSLKYNESTHYASVKIALVDSRSQDLHTCTWSAVCMCGATYCHSLLKYACKESTSQKIKLGLLSFIKV